MNLKITTHNKNIDKFLTNLLKDLKRYNVELEFSLDAWVQCGASKSNGFFEDSKDGGILACSFGKPINEWLKILVHESCHFDQWKVQSKYWTDAVIGRTDACTLLFNWIENPKLKRSKEAIERYANILRDLELDCERRAIEKIKKYNLPIDITQYCKEASAYILFYNFIKETRKWYVIGKEPYNMSKIVKLMPSNLLGDYSQLSDKLRKLYKECVK